jgi:hypothetical protein
MMSGFQWKFMGAAPIPVKLKANPPQTNTITGTIRSKMEVFFKIEKKDCIPHLNMPDPRIE